MRPAHFSEFQSCPYLPEVKGQTLALSPWRPLSCWRSGAVACEVEVWAGGPSLLPAGCPTAAVVLKPGGFALQRVVGKVRSYFGVSGLWRSPSGQRTEMLLNLPHCTGQPLSLLPPCQRLSRAPNVKSAQVENPGPEEVSSPLPASVSSSVKWRWRGRTR